MKLCIVTVASLVAFSPVFLVSAQALPCGDIIQPTNFYDPNSPLKITAVEDCSDPFKVDTDRVQPYTLKINNSAHPNGGTIPVPNGRTNQIDAVGVSNLSGYNLLLFKHDGNNYRFVPLVAGEKTATDYEEYAETYFQTQADRVLYLDIYTAYNNTGNTGPYFYDENGDPKIDASTGQSVQDRFFAFINSYEKPNPFIEAGTYTLLIKEYQLFNTQKTILERFVDIVIPTAHAVVDESGLYPEYRYTITFTLTEEEPEPTGASSVLFLPGIQASRLYAGTDLPEVYKSERVWEPGNNDDVRALEMTSQGSSINNLYTKDILDTTTIDILFGYQAKYGDVYKNFSSHLDTLVLSNDIKEWRPYAYDWRYDVFDIVRDGAKINEAGDIELLFNVVKDLAADSYTKKVTIVAHSNGGLLAKALMIQLKTLGRENLIDHIVFVGTPHLGTPKAIGTILHGFDQEYGFGYVSDSKVARKIINNLPGAYSLLPSKKYLEIVNDAPIISHAGGQITSNYDQYKGFLVGDSARSGDLGKSIKLPARANTVLMDRALLHHADKLDNWVAPSSTKVSTIIGTGLPTMKGIFYQNVHERVCQNNQTTTTLCPVVNEETPMALLSKYGDGTVMAQSARESGSGDRYFIDLKTISGLEIGKTYSHSNITETFYVQNLIKNIVLGTTTVPDSQYVTTLIPQLIEKYTIQKIASPVQIYSKDKHGNISGVVRTGSSTWELKLDIPGSDYFEFAGVRYLVTPSDADITSTLQGDGNGGYSLLIETIDGNDRQTTLHTLQNATVTPQMMATYSKTGDIYSSIKTDLNGDGITDIETTITGLPVKSTYMDLRLAIKALNLPRPQDLIITKLVTLAEQANKQKVRHPIFKPLEKLLLKKIPELLEQFKKRKLVTQTQVDLVNKIISSIVNN